MSVSKNILNIQSIIKQRKTDSLSMTKTGDVFEVGVDLLLDNPYQPRATYNNLETLSSSIKMLGQIQPITITPAEDGKYYIVAGHRRTRATRLAGIVKLKALLVPSMSGEELRNIAMAENLHRDQLSPAEIALHIKQIQKDYPSIKKKKIASMLGISQSSVSNYIKTISLSVEILRKMEEYEIGRDILLLLSKIEDNTILSDAIDFIELNPLVTINELSSKFCLKSKTQSYKIVEKPTSSTIFYGTVLSKSEQQIVGSELSLAMKRASLKIKQARS